MKRKLILLTAVIVLMACFGKLLKSPPSIIDTVTGATPKATKEEQEAAQLDGSYYFCMNTEKGALSEQSVREDVKAFVIGKKEELTEGSELKLTMYVMDTDYALLRYAKKLCARFKEAGADAKVKEYNSEMLFSRVLTGWYEILLAGSETFDVSLLEQADYIVLNSEEME